MGAHQKGKVMRSENPLHFEQSAELKGESI